MAAGGPSAGRTRPAEGITNRAAGRPRMAAFLRQSARVTGRVVVIRPEGRMGNTALSDDSTRPCMQEVPAMRPLTRASSLDLQETYRGE